MRKIIVMMVFLLAASVVTQANAPDMHAFYNPATLKRAKAGQLSDADQRDAFKALFSRKGESVWWNNIPTCSYDQMRAIYSKHLMELYKLPEMPSNEAMLALVDRSQLVPAPAKVNTAGIIVGTATVKRFTRDAYLNEKMFVSEGIAWASGGCGNLGGNIFDQPDTLPIREEFDRSNPPRPPVQFVCEGCPDRRSDIDVNQNQNVRTTGIDPAILALLLDKKSNSDDDWMKQYMQMQMMKEMMNPRQQSAEVVTKSRANAWDVIAGVTGIANMGLNIWDLARESRSNRNYNYNQYTQQQYQVPTPSFPTWGGNNQQPQYGGNWGRPRTPQRPNYDTGTWYDRRNPPLPDTDYQGGSGNYVIGNGWGYQNANAGLGVGAGYDYGYGNSRSNPLNDNGNGRAVDTRNGRVYTYDRSW